MEEVKHTNRKRKANIVRDVASGYLFFNVLWEKHRRYVLLLFVLTICYISQHYYVEQTVYAAKKMENELERTRMEYTIRSSELMRLSKYSAVEQELKKRNMTLVAPARPPKQIRKD
ncbi:MAG: hypothetical protein LBT61_01560 [Prevotellaceae bacterium]|jgi:predicted membrane protein|nr:hypothetical protein [Prevotellaceae bacterium]